MDDAVEDVLGAGWTARTIRLRPDVTSRATGVDPVATLVSRRVVDSTRVAVLYVHGFVDYFFQTHVADGLAAAGYQLYAVDLRDNGRSIRAPRPPMTTNDLSAYVEELDAAYRAVREAHQHVVLLGHSTGGLVAALWADARPGLLDAVVLNSPWLDLRGSWVDRTVTTGVLDVVGAITPALVVKRLGRHYGEALHVSGGGEWDYDLAWKPYDDPPVTAGFVRTVRRAQARVARGLWIDCPVLVLAADRAGPDDRWHEELVSTDSVLDPDDIERLAPQLGTDVTFVRVSGGAHDLALSPAPARQRYLALVVDFLDARCRR